MPNKHLFTEISEYSRSRCLDRSLLDSLLPVFRITENGSLRALDCPRAEWGPPVNDPMVLKKEKKTCARTQVGPRRVKAQSGGRENGGGTLLLDSEKKAHLEEQSNTIELFLISTTSYIYTLPSTTLS
jgi:hypothetical protein